MKTLESELQVLLALRKDLKVYYKFFCFFIFLIVISCSLYSAETLSGENKNSEEEDFFYSPKVVDNRFISPTRQNNQNNGVLDTNRTNDSMIWTFVYLGLIIAGLFIFKKFFAGVNLSPVSKLGEVIDVLSVGPNKTLVVVKLLERVYILGVTDHNISVVAEIYDSDTLHSISRYLRKNNGNSGFTDLFNQKISQWSAGKENEKINEIHQKNESSVRDAMRKIEKASEEN